jgi:hypothetical protein
VLFHVDLRTGGEPCPQELGANPLGELGLGEEKEVVVGTPDHDERRDYARLGREQERLAGLAGREGFDVVREHALEVVRGVWPSHADEAATPASGRPLSDAAHPG